MSKYLKDYSIGYLFELLKRNYAAANKMRCKALSDALRRSNGAMEEFAAVTVFDNQPGMLIKAETADGRKVYSWQVVVGRDGRYKVRQHQLSRLWLTPLRVDAFFSKAPAGPWFRHRTIYVGAEKCKVFSRQDALYVLGDRGCFALDYDWATWSKREGEWYLKKGDVSPEDEKFLRLVEQAVFEDDRLLNVLEDEYRRLS